MSTPIPLNNVDLAEVAKRMKVDPVLSLDDLPKGIDLIEAPEHLVKMLKRGGHTAISRSGMIYTACPTNHGEMNALKNVVARALNLNRHDIRVAPTSEVVVKTLLGLRNATHEEMHSERVHTDTDAQQLLAELIGSAVKRGSSDIHLFVEQNAATVKMRIDGRLRQVRRITAEEATLICSVAVNNEAAKSNGTTTHFKASEPLDATFPVRLASGAVQIRFALTPSKDGYKVVLRVLAFADKAQELPSLEQLGYPPEQWMLIERTIQAPQGLIVVSGPTGSGKSTTLAVMMRMLPDDKAIYSYEDPIENHIPNALQVPVKADNDKCNWVALSRNSLRMDPDAIMYGELRERAVAEVIVQAASTGHLVLTTLHTNSAPSIVQRMHDLGVSYHRLADPGFLRLLMFQRLIAKACPDCSVPLTEYDSASPAAHRTVERLRKHFFDSNQVRVHVPGTSCKTCDGTGLHKRALVAEVVLVDQRGREFIERGDLAGWLAYLRSKGWKDVKDHAEVLVREGMLCPLFAQMELGVEFGPELLSIEVDYKSLAEEARLLAAATEGGL